MNPNTPHLLEALRPVTQPERLAWLEQALERILASEDLDNDLSTLSAMTRRRIGTVPLEACATVLDTAAGPVALRHWNSAEAARALLILTGMEAAADNGHAAIRFLFRHGDETERATVARGLALFDPDAALKPLIMEAGRANSLQLVSAVSLHNPYPQAHYQSHEFNQLVLKNLFVGLPIDGVMGLTERADEELARMCEDYYDERIAAFRDVPEDIWLALAPHASARGEQLLLEYLSHDSPGHRCYASKAIGLRLKQRPGLRESLEKQLQSETDTRVIEALQVALAG